MIIQKPGASALLLLLSFLAHSLLLQTKVDARPIDCLPGAKDSTAAKLSEQGRAPASLAAACDLKSLSICNEVNKFGHRALKLRIHIDAPANIVWETIRENRASDPDVQYSKITQVNGSERLLEQKYTAIPIFGSTTCIIKLNEDTYRRIDYNLLKSDRLSEFEGTWVLSSSEDGRSTDLELSNHLKLKLPVPQRIIDAFAGPKMKARLILVKQMAENKSQLQIASKD